MLNVFSLTPAKLGSVQGDIMQMLLVLCRVGFFFVKCRVFMPVAENTPDAWSLLPPNTQMIQAAKGTDMTYRRCQITQNLYILLLLLYYLGWARRKKYSL